MNFYQRASASAEEPVAQALVEKSVVLEMVQELITQPSVPQELTHQPLVAQQLLLVQSEWAVWVLVAQVVAV
jgi:hypothetical protein